MYSLGTIADEAALEEEEEESDMCFALSDDEETAPQASVVPLPQLVHSAATILKSPMNVNYTVEALTTIPSDGLSYKVLVATVPFDAVITHVTTPRKAPIAYLQVCWRSISARVELTHLWFYSALSRIPATTICFPAL